MEHTRARSRRAPASTASGQMFATILLTAAVFVAALAGNARGASSNSIAVVSSVGSVLSLTDGCGSTMAISVTLSAYQSNTCAFSFGATNDSTTTMRISSSPGAFLAGGVFADHTGGCGVLVGDTAGVKVTSTAVGVSSDLGCTISAAGTNADFIGVPDTFTNACSGTTLGAAANSCTLAIGVRETGGDALAGSYAGTLNLDVIG